MEINYPPAATPLDPDEIADLIPKHLQTQDELNAWEEANILKAYIQFAEKPIKKFTKMQFEKLWEAIQKFEGYKVGKIVEVYRISSVQILGKNNYRFCLNGDEWASESKCIHLAEKRKVELEVCVSKLGNSFLRSPPDNLFQGRLEDLCE